MDILTSHFLCVEMYCLKVHVWAGHVPCLKVVMLGWSACISLLSPQVPMPTSVASSIVVLLCIHYAPITHVFPLLRRFATFFLCLETS